MKTKIEEVLPNHILVKTDSPDIYIVDYKKLNGGDVVLLIEQPSDIKYVYLENRKPVGIYFDGFKDNALPIRIGFCCKQCECVLFPESCTETDWVLFIETKYTNDIVSAFKENNGYPYTMINQIIDTVTYFREKGILTNQRRAHAIVSFPNLIDEFNSTFFSGELSETDILLQHNILIRATNSALIKSEKRINLNAI